MTLADVRGEGSGLADTASGEGARSMRDLVARLDEWCGRLQTKKPFDSDTQRHFAPATDVTSNGSSIASYTSGVVMPASFAEIEAEALKLSTEERMRLADHLLASVSAETDIEAVWVEEIERRLAEVEAGAPLVSLDDAIARARRAIS